MTVRSKFLISVFFMLSAGAASADSLSKPAAQWGADITALSGDSTEGRETGSSGYMRAADYVIAHSGQILDPATADQHHRVLLQVVSDARDVSVDLVAVGKPHSRDLAQRRVGLLGRSGLDLRAHAAFLRRALQGRRAHLVALLDTRLANKLIDGRHVVSRDCICAG